MTPESHAVLLKVAKHIEANPEAFEFSIYRVPDDLDGCGCILAWAGFFAGIYTSDVEELETVARHLGISRPSYLPQENRWSSSAEGQLYEVLSYLDNLDRGMNEKSWHDDPVRAARAIREFVKRDCA